MSLSQRGKHRAECSSWIGLLDLSLHKLSLFRTEFAGQDKRTFEVGNKLLDEREMIVDLGTTGPWSFILRELLERTSYGILSRNYMITEDAQLPLDCLSGGNQKNLATFWAQWDGGSGVKLLLFKGCYRAVVFLAHKVRGLIINYLPLTNSVTLGKFLNPLKPNVSVK